MLLAETEIKIIPCELNSVIQQFQPSCLSWQFPFHFCSLHYYQNPTTTTTIIAIALCIQFQLRTSNYYQFQPQYVCVKARLPSYVTFSANSTIQ